MRLVARLALADALHDRRLFLSAALTVAAVLAPLLLLLGLKAGVVDHLLGRLRADPHARQLVLKGHASFAPAWFATMRGRPDVAFVAPRIRELAQSVQVAAPADGSPLNWAKYWISGQGDPLLGPVAAKLGPGSVALSPALAEHTGLKAGDRAMLQVRRLLPGGARVLRLPVAVAGIAPLATMPDSQLLAVFGPQEIGARLEAAQESDAAPARAYPFASFRLYARDIGDVLTLERDLNQAGYTVSSDARAIAQTTGIDRSLGRLFLVLTGCASLGAMVALASSLWGNVERKRRALSLLRLLGVPARALVAFPLLQAALVAGIGALCGAALALSVGAAINLTNRGAYLGGDALCRLGPGEIAGATAITLALALVAGAAAVRPVLRLQPADGLREQ
jgi:putative ABC transport system permease protein